MGGLCNRMRARMSQFRNCCAARSTGDWKSMPDSNENDFASQRRAMVRDQIAARGIRDRRVLEALARVPRHRFVPEARQAMAYSDGPLPIGHNQTISQPYIVALMSALLRLEGSERVLEIGAGCGYQTAVLAELAAGVYAVEIVEELARRARTTLTELGYENVHVRSGDGRRGCPEEAPFDAILAAAAPASIPQALVDQLRPGGRLVLPVGEASQDLLLLEKDPAGQLQRRSVTGVRFVPMTGDDSA